MPTPYRRIEGRRGPRSAGFTPPGPVTRTPPPDEGRSSFRQVWSDLLFVHWEVRPQAVADLFPPGTRPDVIDGRTFVGLVYFEMRDLSFAMGPALPVIGHFPEINVRLYSVDATGRRGVVFLSLDCARLLPTLAARGAFGLPYRWASARRLRFGDRLLYTVRRRGPAGGRSRVWGTVEEEERHPSPLDDFLTARWGLHAEAWGRTYYWPLHHEPWRFQQVDLLSLEDELIGAATGLPVADSPPASVLYSPGLPVHFGIPIRVGAAGTETATGADHQRP
ncbi:YqjF family protein [Streptomyces sp. NPDC093089]|uniref:YqjF family protein n=1 Tax=Streptomyces sp. NPDC093089 TaxID=3366024 RepID=UPI0037F38F60